MKVLLANKYPPGGRVPIGGVQTWISTVSKELKRRGHQVCIWGPEWSAPDARFDLGIFANIKHTRQALKKCRRTLVISHGIIPDEEPAGGDVHAFTSDEVRAHWNGTGPVFRQPIDLEFWAPGEGPKTLLVRCSYRGGLRFLPSVARRLNLGFYHAKDLSAEYLRGVYRNAACVIATGRAAVEAMATGAPVVICDDRPYQGPLHDRDTLGSMARNYSGRGGQAPTAAGLAESIQAAREFGSLREHTEINHNVRKIVGEMLCYTC